jgi:hypothetical protein
MTHQAHQPGHYVAGQPLEITLVNDNGHEYPDWLWHDLDVVSEKTLDDHIAPIAGKSEELTDDECDIIQAAFRFQVCINVYDSWWGRVSAG